MTEKLRKLNLAIANQTPIAGIGDDKSRIALTLFLAAFTSSSDKVSGFSKPSINETWTVATDHANTKDRKRCS